MDTRGTGEEAVPVKPSDFLLFFLLLLAVFVALPRLVRSHLASQPPAAPAGKAD